MIIRSNFYTLIPYERFLYIESLHSWDGRVSMQYIKDLRCIILKRYVEEPWAILHDSRGWDLGTPEAEHLLSSMVSTQTTGSLTHHAMIVDTSEIKKWQLKKIFQDVVHYDNRFFYDPDEAMTSLESFGYTKTQAINRPS